jgi:hypothetical protein
VRFQGFLAGSFFLICSQSACAQRVQVDVGFLLDDHVSLHGAAASKVPRSAKRTKELGQAPLVGKLFSTSSLIEKTPAVDLRHKTRKDLRNLSVSPPDAITQRKPLHFDVTLASTRAAGSTSGTQLLDQSGDATLQADVGSGTYWVGVTQHVRGHLNPRDRKQLAELYAGTSRKLGRRTSLRGVFYHAQSDELGNRSTTNVSVSLNRELPSLGSVQLSTLRSQRTEGQDLRAAVSLEVDHLPF